MAKTTMKFQWRNDDFCDVYLDEDLLFTVDYDAYGRGGQTEMISALRLIADRAGWEISVSEISYDED